MLSVYLNEIRETDQIYLTEGLVHPGQILRLANMALIYNVVLGPWIYVGSCIRNHAAARVGQQLTLRSKIASNIVSKGHAIVEFDAIVVADGARTVVVGGLSRPPDGSVFDFGPAERHWRGANGSALPRVESPNARTAPR